MITAWSPSITWEGDRLILTHYCMAMVQALAEAALAGRAAGRGMG
jgi:hypothetical protein